MLIPIMQMLHNWICIIGIPIMLTTRLGQNQVAAKKLVLGHVEAYEKVSISSDRS